MAEESARLRIPYIAASQAQKHVTHNEGMTLLDTLTQLSVLDKDLTAPPASPAEGDCYIVAAGATGAWLGWDNRIARYIDGEWRSYLPGAGSGAGWRAYVIDESALYIFNGSAWTLFTGAGGVSDGDKGDVTVSGAGTVWTIDNDTISDAKLRDSAALSVIGRSVNSSGDPADLTASSDGQVLRRSGTSLGFGTIATAGIGDDEVTFAKLQNIATDRLIGRDTASSGDPEEISVGGGIEFTGSGGVQRSALTGDVTASAGSNATTVVSASDTVAGKIEIAVQSEMEAATDTVRAVVPGRLHHHPGVAKAWGKAGVTGSVNASYGVSSVSDNGTGDISWNWSVTFSSADYGAMAVSLATGGTAKVRNAVINAQTTTALQVLVSQQTPSLIDPTNHLVAAFGDL